jgi:lysozyme
MKPSREGIEILMESEGLRLKQYDDEADLQTIGIGHLLTRQELASGVICCGDDCLHFGDGITRDQAIALYQSDLGNAAAAINRLVKVPLNQFQFDSLCSFVFNVGEGAFTDSTILKKLNMGNFSEIPNLMREWHWITKRRKVNGQVVREKVHSPGLAKRREREVALFIKTV